MRWALVTILIVQVTAGKWRIGQEVVCKTESEPPIDQLRCSKEDITSPYWHPAKVIDVTDETVDVEYYVTNEKFSFASDSNEIRTYPPQQRLELATIDVSVGKEAVKLTKSEKNNYELMTTKLDDPLAVAFYKSLLKRSCVSSKYYAISTQLIANDMWQNSGFELKNRLDAILKSINKMFTDNNVTLKDSSDNYIKDKTKDVEKINVFKHSGNTWVGFESRKFDFQVDAQNGVNIAVWEVGEGPSEGEPLFESLSLKTWIAIGIGIVIFFALLFLTFGFGCKQRRQRKRRVLTHNQH